MSNADLRNAVVERSGMPKDLVASVLDSLASVLVEQMARGNKVQVAGLGTFDVVSRSERSGRNPQTGEPLTIPARKAVKFTAAASLKRAAADG